VNLPQVPQILRFVLLDFSGNASTGPIGAVPRTVEDTRGFGEKFNNNMGAGDKV
jgi:hypothetical protein